MEKVIVWNKRPARFLSQALKKISEDSLVQAERIEEELLISIRALSANPEKYPPDQFKIDNPGNFRAFEKLSFQIAYKLQSIRSGSCGSGM